MLLSEIREGLASGKPYDGARAHDALERALDELESNLTSVERACVVNRRSPVAHAAWLGRLLGLIASASKAVGGGDEVGMRLASGVSMVEVLPPLAPRGRVERHEHDAQPGQHAGGTRLLELELAAVDRLLEAARDETAVLGRRRRMLEAARQMLLRCAARRAVRLALALGGAGAGIRQRRARARADLAHGARSVLAAGPHPVAHTVRAAAAGALVGAFTVRIRARRHCRAGAVGAAGEGRFAALANTWASRVAAHAVHGSPCQTTKANQCTSGQCVFPSLAVQSPLAMSQYCPTAHSESLAQSPVQTMPLHEAGSHCWVPLS